MLLKNVDIENDYEVWVGAREFLHSLIANGLEIVRITGGEKYKAIFKKVRSDYMTRDLKMVNPESEEFRQFIKKNRENLQYIVWENDDMRSHWVKISHLEFMGSNLRIVTA